MTTTAFSELSISQLYTRLSSIVIDSRDSRSTFSNWAKTFSCRPLTVFLPNTEDDCQAIVELARREQKSVRCVGAGHSPSDLACTTGFMIRTDNLTKVFEVDIEKNVVEVQSGISLHAFHRLLASHGLAMSNLGSISDQSIGGILTTATHGSGVDYPVISAGVTSLTMLLADNTIVECSRESFEDLFLATLCGLGTTGMILRVRIAVERAFRLDETIEPVEFDQFVEPDNFERIAGSSQHTRVWWFPQVGKVSVGCANRTSAPPDPAPGWGAYFRNVIFGFHIVQFLLFVSRFIPSLTPPVCRLVWKHLNGRTQRHIGDSYKVFNFDCLFPQYTTEWAIPAESAPECLKELRTWLDQEAAKADGVRIHFPIEIRWTKEDDIWLSPSYGRKTVYIGIVQFRPYGLPVSYRRYFANFVRIVKSYEGRPHWAKAHNLTPGNLRALYPKFDAFVELMGRYDPDGLFENEYVKRHLLGMPIGDGVFRSSGRVGE
ncbi:l-gulonolactone d-arabinono--lactone oxidase [Phaffia rhodozyma]|uniref:D-arabinono-1,4-lactone oxidase n=1 Tax=Phaffia rhodozyma TaxID=264483 RepID=A0A0F7SXS5_PHARH|nr:l-gulonolactone d-arabinono--lactone oxidase [Phaffia rhodozyma]